MKTPLMLGAASLLALASTAHAQDLELVWKYGLLDWTWGLELSGAPGSGFVLIPSFQTGPLPLSLIDPPNGGVLEVGLDLPDAIRTGFLDGSGQAELLYGLPNAPVLVGLDLRAQAVPFPGAGSLLGAPSNPIATRLTRLGDDVATQGPPIAPRALHAQIALPDGRVLLFGGRRTGGLPALALEWFDPQTQAFEAAGVSLPQGVLRPEAVLLASGDVLFAGGFGFTGQASSQCWVFSSATGTLDTVDPLVDARVFHTLERLPNGRVLAIGGTQGYTLGHPVGLPASLDPSQFLATTEVFDPATGKWSSGPALPGPRSGHASSQATPGSLFVTGGFAPTPRGVQATDTVFAGNGLASWSNAGRMLEARALHAQVETVDGELLISGGAVPASGALAGVAGSELFDPVLATSSIGPTGSGIVINGREVCLPAPRVPSSPSEAPTSVLGGTPGPFDPPIVYFMISGYSAVGADPGSVVVDDDALRTIEATEPWFAMTPGVDVGLGQRVTPIDEGLRLLFVGPAGARLLTVE